MSRQPPHVPLARHRHSSLFEFDSPRDWPPVNVYDPEDLKTVVELTHTQKELAERNTKLLSTLHDHGPQRMTTLRWDAEAELLKLANDMPHFSGVIDELLDFHAVATHTKAPLQAMPLLLVGPPGIGKSHFCSRLAKALGVPGHTVAMDSAQGPSQLSGSSTYWANTQVGMVFNALALGPHISPLIVLDELDKVQPDGRHDPLSSLHGLLEPVTARRFQDLSFPLTLDASHVLWVATANRLDGLAEPLRSRFSVHVIAAPTPAQARGIAEAMVRHALVQSDALKLQFSANAIDKLAQSSPRQQRQRIHRAMGKALRRKSGVVLPEDILTDEQGVPQRRPIGFVPLDAR